MLAVRTWNALKIFLQLTLVAASLGALLPSAAAHARAYDVFTVDVPFEFTVGDRTFRPGHYDFIFAGNGLLALRDSRSQVVASLVTRSVETGKSAPASRVIFKTSNKRTRLAQIAIENSSQVVEIVGEQMAQPSQLPSFVPGPPAFSFGDRNQAPRLRH